ncbi:MAG TPA: amino acid adenylation domain-containing protein, partial [Longimicrobiaceae bacterium]|nr:amino acid adenylation domain-containing protein [Longimicrobiaceae bacterium]
TRLAAYVVPRGPAPEPAELREHLRRSLPDPVVPSTFATLEALPLTPSGKLDRRALPRPEAGRGGTRAEYVAPRNEVEAALAGIWAEVLGLAPERVGVRDGFFELGGHSLLAVRVASWVQRELGVTLPLHALFQSPTVESLALRLAEEQLRAQAPDRGDGAAPAPGIPRRIPGERCPLSFSQQRLWFVDRYEPGSAAYHALSVVRFDGALDVEALRSALDGVVARHEALRTVFAERGGEAEQVVLPPLRVPFRVEDLGAPAAGEVEEEVERRVRREARLPFDLTEGPLVRAVLLRTAADRHHLVLTLHHIAGDAWSRGILVREVSALYGARVRGEEPQLPEPPIQYPDYAAWQRARLRGPLLREQLDWWTERLRGAPPVLELPADRPRPPVHPVEGALHRFRVPAPAVEALRRLAREEEATPFLVLLAAFKVFLARYTGETDLVVGTPVANRGRAETEGVVGFFANTLALRTDLAGDPPFRELLRRVRETALGAYAHEELPFERLVEELRPERDLSRPVVFQTMFVLDGDPPRPLCLPGVEMVPVDSHPGTSPFDLTLRMEDGAAGLAGGLEYATALFDAATAARMAEHFVTLLEGIASGPDARISRLPLMSAAERRRVLAEWNDTGRPYPAGDCVHDLFARQAARTPDATALVFRGETLSYAELDRRVNRLANGLRARGVGPETRVGVCLERTPELVVALLAVLKAGGAYVPLDPAHPAERLGYVVEDAGVRLVLTTSALAGRLPRGAVVPVLLDVAAERAAAQADGAPESGATPENLSHVIFTSGSTGRPKGVMIRHSSVVVLLHWLRENVSDEERSAVLFSTSVGFDVSVAEVLGTLAWGGKLVLVENALELASVEEAVVYASMVPTAAAELLRAGGIPRSVRTLNLGGEALPGDLAQALYASGVERVGNLYGPTEDTTYSTYSLVERGGSRVTVGQPVANTRAYVLDGRLEPVPVGVVGELYLAGDGLARGYASRPDLTAGRFLPNPFGPAGSRMYRVMDRVRWRADGELEYFGRTDFQVKVRGFRIELGEIEATLLRHPGVHEAVAVVREDRPGDRRIVAYLAAAEGSAVPPAAELRAQLRERLPEYMVPSAFVVLAALPRTPSGKLDRRALPPPDASAGAAYVAPCTPTEEALAGIWAEALGVARVGAGESFFDLGGHSLLGTRVVSRVRDDLGVEVPLRVLFEAPVLAEFAERVDALRPAGDGASGAPRPDVIRPRETDGPVPLSFAQQRLWFIHQLQPGSAAYNLSAAFRIRGPLDVEALRRALEEVVRRHEALRTTFSSVAGRAAQVIHPAGGFRLPMLDLGGLEGEEREAELRLRVGAEESTPFDLATGPLLRVLLIRLGEREHALLLTLHHIVSDGWSTEVMVRELAELYGAFREGRPSPLPPLPVQYADYAVWQRSWLAGETLERQLAWWRDLLAGAPPLLELPTDCPRPRVPGTEGGSRPLALPAELADELRAFSRREGATPFMTLMAAWQVLLGRHAGQTDVVVGMPIAGRNRVETEGLIGFFVNTLAIRTDFSGGPDSRALLHRVRETMLGAHQHQDLPFEKLVEELGVERSLGHTPLFQAVLAPHRAEGPGPRLAGVELEPIHAVGSTAKFDLTLSLTDDGEGLRGALGFRAELFDVPTVDRLLGHFVILLQGMATSPETPVAELPLLAEWERDRVLTGWNTTGEAPAGRCIHPLVEEAVRAAPEAVAVSWRGARVTYAELDARAGRLANRLRALGVGPEARVGVCLERTPELVVALLAVLRAGGAYVPLDPDYPVERLLYLLDDAGARVLVTEAALAEGLARPRMAVVRVDADREAIAGESPEAPESGVRPENLAYVLYTSGSTGTPKGVMVDHAALAAHVVTIRGAYGITSADRVLHFAAAVFDPALEQLLTALVCGATVVLRPQELWSPAELRRHLAEESVTVANLPTAYWRQAAAGWAAAGPFPPLRLRLMIAGGERMPPEAATLWRRGPLGEVRLLNAYGPTEATVTATLHEVPRGDPAPSGRVPIGRALPGRRAYVLDGAGAPVPVGVPGELHLGGASLARGYLGRPELTAEAFVPDPWGGEAGARLYRTGDRVRWLPTGELEYLGRADVQVKVRGFRIEPGEVEAALRAHPAVGDATVVARDDTPGGQRLVAYLTPAPGTAAPPAAELRAHLRAGLPEHMVPGAFVVLEALPTTPSGKVDRGALPVPEGRPEGEEYVPPCTPTERVVAAVWAETLGIERVGAHDNFFDLGGHSLLLVQMHARLQERLRTGVSVAKLFQFRTLADLARHLDD